MSNAPAEGFDLVAQEGALSDAATGTLNADGTVSDITVTKNTKLEAYNSIAALSAFQWRHDMNDLTKRMGELRTSPEGVGAWARIYGSEQEHGGIQAKNTSIQVGSDVDVGAGWKVGAAFTYTDGKADHDLGNADNKSYGLGIYGTWFADNGQFVDLIAKYSRMDTDFTADSMTGGFDNNAYSVSAEYGWHVKLGQFAFVEPQAEVTYGQVLGDTFTAGNGVKVSRMTSMHSSVASVCARASTSRTTRASSTCAPPSCMTSRANQALDCPVKQHEPCPPISEVPGTKWGSAQNFNVTDNTYTYVVLEKTSGGEVDQNWRWNIGVRHTF